MDLVFADLMVLAGSALQDVLFTAAGYFLLAFTLAVSVLVGVAKFKLDRSMHLRLQDKAIVFTGKQPWRVVKEGSRSLGPIFGKRQLIKFESFTCDPRFLDSRQRDGASISVEMSARLQVGRDSDSVLAWAAALSTKSREELVNTGADFIQARLEQELKARQTFDDHDAIARAVMQSAGSEVSTLGLRIAFISVHAVGTEDLKQGF